MKKGQPHYITNLFKWVTNTAQHTDTHSSTRTNKVLQCCEVFKVQVFEIRI